MNRRPVLKNWVVDVLSTEAGLLPLWKIALAKVIRFFWRGFRGA